MKILIYSLFIIFLTITCAFAQGNGDPRPGGPNGPGDANADWGPQREAFLEKYDTDGNGQISATEKAQARADMQEKGVPGQGRRPAPPLTDTQRQQVLEKFDANGDGELGPEERQAARQTVHGFMLERFDANGNGQLDPEERKAMARATRKMKRKGGADRRAQMKERFDTNKDGVLDASEKEAARQAIKDRRQKNQGNR